MAEDDVVGSPGVAGRLTPLPGTAPEGAWKAKTGDGAPAELHHAVFPILIQNHRRQVSILGTGFFVCVNGTFVTAAHVAHDIDTEYGIENCSILQTFPNGNFFRRPLLSLHYHSLADVAVCLPAPLAYKGKNVRSPILTLTRTAPALGSHIGTYSYPLHKIYQEDPSAIAIHLEATYYDGTLCEYFHDRGPSAKLSPPYFHGDIHLYGASSGGPVMDTEGRVFAVASSSFDGAEDASFYTPIMQIEDLVLSNQKVDPDGPLEELSIKRIIEMKYILVKD